MIEATGAGAARTTTTPAIRLVDLVPEFAAEIPEADRAMAGRVLVAPLLGGRDEDLARVFATPGLDPFDFIVVDGVVLKETTLNARSALEVLTAGDVLAPPLTRRRQNASAAVSRYLAHGPVRLAVLGPRFREAARRWPGLSDVLHDRLGQQTHRASMHMAMLHIARVDDRVLALFADLAERTGRMTADGIVVEMPLTHELIGRLVGSRRPTVTLALRELAEAGRLDRREDGSWLLAPDAAAQTP